MPAPHHSVFYRPDAASCRPTNSVKALKAKALKPETSSKEGINVTPRPVAVIRERRGMEVEGNG